MSLLEWTGVIAIVLFIALWLKNIYFGGHPERFSKDPNYEHRQKEFEKMRNAFVEIERLCDQDLDPHNEVIAGTLTALYEVRQNTVPMPKESFASDYFSRYVDYLTIYSLANAIIRAEVDKKQIDPADLKLGSQ